MFERVRGSDRAVGVKNQWKKVTLPTETHQAGGQDCEFRI